MDKEQLDRIENGIRFLVKSQGFKYRNAWDGHTYEEKMRLSRKEEENIDSMVEKIMNTGSRY